MTFASPLPYALTEANSRKASQLGLAEAAWYTSPVPEEQMRQFLTRRDWPAVRDTIIWFSLLFGFGYWGYCWWGSAWAAIPFMLYGVIYGTTSDSRWHEAGHGTAFKTDWLNDALYEVACFMVMREPVVWRWSHTRHHSDTIVVGRDPEIAVPRPPSLAKFILAFFGIPQTLRYFVKLSHHCVGRLLPDEATYVPKADYPSVFWHARAHALIHCSAAGLALYYGSFLPLMYIGLPNIYGNWLMAVYGNTQHAGLAENVLDHRLNCRTVYMNWINRYLYWNMNYHVEHHMFPLVPYHALPRLHEAVKADMPKPYASTWEAWKELFPAMLRQRREPGYFVKRDLPAPARSAAKTVLTTKAVADDQGWLAVCDETRLGRESVVRFDHEGKTYALYRDAAGVLHASDGICTHGRTHLADGLVIGDQIECPKHNGRFKLRDGSPARTPVCVALQTYAVESRAGRLFVNLAPAGETSKAN